MRFRLRTCLTFAALTLRKTTAQTISPSNTSVTLSTLDLLNPGYIGLWVSDGDSLVSVAQVVPLTNEAKTSLPSGGLAGEVYLLNDTSQLGVRYTDIAIACCDTVPGNIQAIDLLLAAVQTNVTGLLFYSLTAEACALDDYDWDYQWIYTMSNESDAEKMLKQVTTPDPVRDGQVYARITYPDNASNDTGGTGSGTTGSSGSGSKNPLGPSPTTAVAMIILYTVTGIIAALFLIIIATGALRAHRHPERYGPRNMIGRPRQSRARGLARAMLDTLPIVKFGEREDVKASDVELAETGTTTTAVEREPEIVDGRSDATATDAPPATQDPTPTQPPQASQSDQSGAETGIAAAVSDQRATSPDHNAEQHGCSICTEDFESGQDQRVLPCDHRFHPDCIDPWLLNVSGTCPLCRIDLRPTTSSGSGEAPDENGNPAASSTAEGGLAPPLLGATGTTGERARTSVRRSIMLGIMGVTGTDRMTREERVLFLRQLRAQQLVRRQREEQAAVAETPEEQSRTRTRLRHLLQSRRRSRRAADMIPQAPRDASLEVQATQTASVTHGSVTTDPS